MKRRAELEDRAPSVFDLQGMNLWPPPSVEDGPEIANSYLRVYRATLESYGINPDYGLLLAVGAPREVQALFVMPGRHKAQ